MRRTPTSDERRTLRLRVVDAPRVSIATDKLQLLFTYLIALVVIVGAGVMYLALPPGEERQSVLPFLTATLGIVIGFVFQRETATSTARAHDRAVTLAREETPR